MPMTTVVRVASLHAMDAVAERLRWVLDQLGISARDLSEKAQISPTHVSTILERGGSRTAGTTLAKIAKAAGISLRWLITGEGIYTDRDPPALCDLPNWHELLATAKTLGSYRDWVWEAVAKLPPVLTAPATAGMLAGLAKIISENLEPPEERDRKSAEKETLG